MSAAGGGRELRWSHSGHLAAAIAAAASTQAGGAAATTASAPGDATTAAAPATDATKASATTGGLVAGTDYAEIQGGQLNKNAPTLERLKNLTVLDMAAADVAALTALFDRNMRLTAMIQRA